MNTLLLAPTVTFSDYQWKTWFVLMCSSAFYHQSTVICHFKAPFLVDYNDIFLSWNISSWVEYILGCMTLLQGCIFWKILLPSFTQNIDAMLKPYGNRRERGQCQDIISTCLKRTIITLCLAIMINFELTFKVSIFFLFSRLPLFHKGITPVAGTGRQR